MFMICHRHHDEHGDDLRQQQAEAVADDKRPISVYITVREECHWCDEEAA